MWNEAPLAIHGPQNDVDFPEKLGKYPMPAMAKAATNAFHRHLWYLSEHLVGLALFDPRVECSVKQMMVSNLRRKKDPKNPRRITMQPGADISLADRVTERTMDLFDMIGTNGKERARAFLGKDPSQWSSDPTFKSLKEEAMKLRVVNDTAERGIALIQTYKSLTKDEDQKQYLLRLVDKHRKACPHPTKQALMK